MSRYGLIDSAMSFDQIGPLTKNVADAALVLSVIAGKDTKDTMSREGNVEVGKMEKVRVGVVRVKGVDAKIQKLIDTRVAEIVKKNSWDVTKIEIEHLDLAVETYYPIQYSEFYSGTRRFDGRRFGKKIEEAGGKEVLRRILGGSEITQAEFAGAYYRKALEVKRLIAEEFAEAFEKVDCLMMPTCPGLPWKVGEGAKMSIEEIYAYDVLTCPANLAGICATSLPAGKIEGIPVGLQVMCAQGAEGKMLGIAREIEDGG